MTAGLTYYAHYAALPNQMADFSQDRTTSYTAGGSPDDTQYALRYINGGLWPYAISTNGNAVSLSTEGIIGTYTMGGFTVDAKFWDRGTTHNGANTGTFTFGKLVVTLTTTAPVSSHQVTNVTAT